ncbi:DUF4145 domain-containing protein [Propionivibrio sp.]|uniref:DUF4145 domain-containing protein n=1 Tax=Propionivibrio sp. TaxID=2212460 RepID=UPI00272EB22B|nr:DUF4145 domain-containing protein [Propionivibrio sp.]
MDWLQFVSGLISSIAWPLVALTFLFMFRTELAKIVQRLAHLKYKDLELDFDKVKQQAEGLHLEVAQEPAIIESPVFTSLEDQILDAVESAPSAAILLAWSGLETAVAAAVSRLAGSPDSASHRSIVHNIEMLIRNGRLSKKHGKLLQEMRTLRNKIAHEQNSVLSISQDQALNYANTAIDLIKHFEGYSRVG